MIIGYLLIYGAVNVKRNKDSELELFSLEWFIVLILVTVGGVIISSAK
jgi:hypothetical protein